MLPIEDDYLENNELLRVLKEQTNLLREILSIIKELHIPQTKHIKLQTKTQAKKVAKSAAVWEAYSSAYKQRYGTMPVRDAMVNSALSKLVDVLGAEAAPEVAAFYVFHNNQWYVSKLHDVRYLLADARKLHTEWVTGQKMTREKANETDRLEEQGQVWQNLIQKYENKAVHASR